MIRLLRLIFLVLLAIFLLTVAFANRAPVVLQFLPDEIGAFLGVDWRIELPLFLVIFAGIVVGLLIGFVWEWFREHKHRAAASQSRRELLKLEREVSRLKATNADSEDDVLALLEGRTGTR